MTSGKIYKVWMFKVGNNWLWPFVYRVVLAEHQMTIQALMISLWEIRYGSINNINYTGFTIYDGVEIEYMKSGIQRRLVLYRFQLLGGEAAVTNFYHELRRRCGYRDNTPMIKYRLFETWNEYVGVLLIMIWIALGTASNLVSEVSSLVWIGIGVLSSACLIWLAKGSQLR